MADTCVQVSFRLRERRGLFIIRRLQSAAGGAALVGPRCARGVLLGFLDEETVENITDARQKDQVEQAETAAASSRRPGSAALGRGPTAAAAAAEQPVGQHAAGKAAHQAPADITPEAARGAWGGRQVPVRRGRRPDRSRRLVARGIGRSSGNGTGRRGIGRHRGGRAGPPAPEGPSSGHAPAGPGQGLGGHGPGQKHKHKQDTEQSDETSFLQFHVTSSSVGCREYEVIINGKFIFFPKPRLFYVQPSSSSYLPGGG